MRMKTKRTSFVTTILVVIALSILGCTPKNESSEASTSAPQPQATVDKYAYMTMDNAYYLVEGKVSVQGDAIIDAQIDEVNTMIFWGQFSKNQISDEEKALLGEDNTLWGLAQLHGKAEDSQFAKYVQVGDVIFTATLRDDGFLTYSSEGIADVVTYFDSDEANIAWFFKEMRAGNYWLLKKTGENSFEKIDISRFTHKADGSGDVLSKRESQSKRSAVHWKNWLPNIQKCEDFFLENGLLDGEIVKTETGEWAVADTVSGATMTEFPNYLGILYSAYEK